MPGQLAQSDPITSRARDLQTPDRRSRAWSDGRPSVVKAGQIGSPGSSRFARACAGRGGRHTRRVRVEWPKCRSANDSLRCARRPATGSASRGGAPRGVRGAWTTPLDKEHPVERLCERVASEVLALPRFSHKLHQFETAICGLPIEVKPIEVVPNEKIRCKVASHSREEDAARVGQRPD